MRVVEPAAEEAIHAAMEGMIRDERGITIAREGDD
jgi:hypothetical protein